MAGEVVGRADVVVRAPLDLLAQDLEQAKGVVQQFINSINQGPGGKPVKPLSDGFKEATQQADLFAKTLNFVRDQLVGLGILLTVKQIEHMADAWTDMRFRLNASVGSLEAADEIMRQLTRTSMRTFTSIESQVDAFNDARTAMSELGYSTKTQIEYLDSLNVALAASGARGDRATRVMDALSRSIAIGSLRSYTLNTILVNGDKVAEAIAKQLGVTTLELRKLGQEGKITSDVIIQAVLKSKASLQELADTLPPTMGDALAAIGKAMQVFIGTMDQALGLTTRNATGLMNLANAIMGAAVPAVAALQGSLKLVDGWLNTFGSSLKDIQGLVNTVFVTLIGGVALVAVLALGRLVLNFLTPAIYGLVGAFRGLAVAILTNPIMGIATVIAGLAVAAFLVRDHIKQAFGIDVVGIFKNTANFIVGSFNFAFESIKFVWSNFPDIMEAFAVEVQNIFIRMSNAITQAVASAINNVVDLVNNASGVLHMLGIPIGKLGHAEAGVIPEIQNTANERLRQRASAISDTLRKALQTDYIGEWAGVFGAAMGSASASVQSFLDQLDHLTGSQDQKTIDALKQITQSVEQFIAKQDLARFSLGMSEEQTKALAYAQDLLFQAINAGVTITPELTNQFFQFGASMAHAEIQTARLTDAFNFAKDAAKGFINDIRAGLEQGKSIWESFGDAVLNVLNKILDKLIDVAVEMAFANLAGIAGGGGGGLGLGVAGAVAKFFGFHKGGIVGENRNMLTRRVTAKDIAGAKKYHTGLLPGEMMGIFQKGEAIVPRNIVQSMLKGQRGWGMFKSGPQISYAPVYNVQGSGPELDRLRAEMARDRVTFAQRTTAAIRDAQSRRQVN